MNGKKAKLVRRIAKQVAAGFPDKEYTSKQHVRTITDKDGMSHPVAAGTQVILGPSKRRFYQQLKSDTRLRSLWSAAK